MTVGKSTISRGAFFVAAIWIVSGPNPLLNAEEPLFTFQGHAGNVVSVAFTRNGAILASASFDGTVKLWDVSKRKELKTLRGHRGHVYALAFSSDGKTLATGGGDPGAVNVDVTNPPVQVARSVVPAVGDIRLWDVATGTEKAVIKCGTHVANTLVFTEGEKVLVSGGLDGTVRRWDVKSARQIEIVQSPVADDDSDTIVAVAKDGMTLSWGTEAGLIRVANRMKKSEWSASHPPHVASLAFSNDGGLLASGSLQIKLWDVRKKKERATLKGHRAGIFALAFTPDDKILASGSGLYRPGKFYAGEIKFWEVSSGREKATYVSHTESVSCLAFSPDGKMLASGSRDKTVKLWKAP